MNDRILFVTGEMFHLIQDSLYQALRDWMLAVGHFRMGHFGEQPARVVLQTDPSPKKQLDAEWENLEMVSDSVELVCGSLLTFAWAKGE